jgi:hypothetical protein
MFKLTKCAEYINMYCTQKCAQSDIADMYHNHVCDLVFYLFKYYPTGSSFQFWGLFMVFWYSY